MVQKTLGSWNGFASVIAGSGTTSSSTHNVYDLQQFRAESRIHHTWHWWGIDIAVASPIIL